MSTYIEYCRHNGDCTVNDVLLDSSLDVDVRFCLDRCGECYDEPFLLVDGEMVTGSSHREILAEIDGIEHD